MAYIGKQVEVIAQHTRDHKIIPLRIRLQDEDGEMQNYTIKAYKETSPSAGTYTMPNGVTVTKGTWSFDCKILVFGILQNIRLFYKPSENLWTIIK